MREDNYTNKNEHYISNGGSDDDDDDDDDDGSNSDTSGSTLMSRNSPLCTYVKATKRQ